MAPLVLTLATAGDQAARRIEADAARELALAVTTVARTLNFPLGALPLAFAGGVLVHHERLRALVVEGVAWTVTPVVVAEPAQSAARALCAMNHEDTDGDS